MPSRGSSLADSDTAEWEIQVIERHDQALDPNRVFLKQKADGLAAEIHVSQRLGQKHRLLHDPVATHQRLTFHRPSNVRSIFPGQRVKHEKSGIVPCPGIPWSRI